VKVSYSSFISDSIRDKVLSSAKCFEDEFSVGVANFSYLPASCHPLATGFLNSINTGDQGQNYVWERSGEPVLSYGIGSLPISKRVKPPSSHTLKILLVLLPQFDTPHSSVTQVINSPGFSTIGVGEGVVVDNLKEQGLLSNSMWAFAHFPLSRKPRLTLIKTLTPSASN
jgi:hypothetical protein